MEFRKYYVSKVFLLLCISSSLQSKLVSIVFKNRKEKFFILNESGKEEPALLCNRHGMVFYFITPKLLNVPRVATPDLDSVT
jgi:hypothetical protein